MAEEKRTHGITTVAPDVVLSIARLTTLEVEGVSRMSVSTHVGELFHKGNRSSGVRVLIDDMNVKIDLFVVLEQDVNVRQISRTIQNDVARAVKEMVGLEIEEIQIHVEDINYDTEE